MLKSPDVVGIGVGCSRLRMRFPGQLAQLMVAVGSQGNNRPSVDPVGNGGEIPRIVVGIGPGEGIGAGAVKQGLGFYRFILKIIPGRMSGSPP